MDFYELARGPCAWISFIIFISGSLYRIVFTLMKGHQHKFLYPRNSIKGGIKSIIYGILPFGSFYMRRHWVLTIITVIFHLCVLTIPVFLLAHVVLWYESWRILFWNIPERLADIMTIAVICACLFFFARRLIVPEVKHVSRTDDFILLLLILTPFLTGFLAVHQWGPYRPMLISHIISGEILLAIIPFSQLGHMLLFWLSRGYMGAEFSKAVKAGDW